MKRRTILVGSGIALSSSVAGCLSSSVESKEYPEIPDPLIRETVVDFVEEYETAEYHNHILENESSADSISVVCDAVFDREIGSTFYVITNCAGTANHESLGGLGSASVTHYETWAPTYRVDEQHAQRVEVDPIDPVEWDGDYTVRLLNFDDTEHELSLVVTPPTESKEEQILADEYTISSETGIENQVAVTVGEKYEITVRLNNADRSEAFEWAVYDQSRGVGIYVTPQRTIDIQMLPSDSPVA